VRSTPTTRSRSKSPSRTVSTETAIATRTRSRTTSSPLRLRDSRVSRARLFEEEETEFSYQQVYEVPYPKKSEQDFFKLKKVTFSTLLVFSLTVTELACLVFLNYPPAPYTSHNLFTYLRTQVYISAVPLLLSIPLLFYVANPTTKLWLNGLNALFSFINLCWLYITYDVWKTCDRNSLPSQESNQCNDFRQWFINLRGFSVLFYAEQLIRCLFSAYQACLDFNQYRQAKETKLVQPKSIQSQLMFLLPSVLITFVEMYFLWGLQYDNDLMYEGSSFGKPLFKTDVTKYLGSDISVLYSIAGLSLLFFGLCIVFKKLGQLFLIGQSLILVFTLLSVAYEETNWDIFRPEKIENAETYSLHIVWFKKMGFFAFLLISSQLVNAVALGVSIFNVVFHLLEKKADKDPIVDRLVFSHNDEILAL